MGRKTDKIMERVRRLLAMAKDTASPNEAAIAASRARKLMDEHQIQEWEIESLDKAAEFGTAHTKKFGLWSSWMAVQVAKYNDCQVVGTENGMFEFQGMEQDVHVSKYMIEYLVEAGQYQYSVFKSCQPRGGKSYKATFLEGFARGVNETLKELIDQRKAQQATGKGLMVVKQQLVESHFGKAKYRSHSARKQTWDEHAAHESGREQGRKQSTHTGVGAPEQRQGLQ